LETSASGRREPPPPTLLRRAALGLLRLFGWRSVLVWPPEPKGIIVVYPHTSNWDFIVGVLFRVGHGLPAHWMGKDSMFRWPLAGLFRRIGGIPVNRRERTGFIDTLLGEFRSRDWMWLAVAPEGTRSRTDHLKSGFYQIALAADLPVGLGYIDYATRTVAIDTYLRFTGDRERDLEALRGFYAPKRGRRPHCEGELRFRQ
jgi:1-acyl-sn-glycerol-3-phosphate acyltransferase